LCLTIFHFIYHVTLQIAERRKLVSSIKESTPDLDDAKASSKQESASSVNANTDATKKEIMDGDANGSVSPSTYGKSSLSKEPEAKTFSPSTESLKNRKQSSASVISSSPVTSPQKPSDVATNGKPWSSVVASSVDPPYKPSSVMTSPEKTSDPVTSPGKPSKSRAGAFWSDPLPSYLTKAPQTSTMKTEKYVEKTPDVASSETNEPGKDEEKPPPLAGANVMNVILVAAECAPFSKTGNYFLYHL